jgi:hypothetical protein
VTNVDDDATIWLDGDDVRVYREWSIPVTREQRQQLIDQLETPTPCPMIARLDAWGKEEGYYWVKLTCCDVWEPAEWSGRRWLLGHEELDAGQITHIHPRRILPPA